MFFHILILKSTSINAKDNVVKHKAKTIFFNKIQKQKGPEYVVTFLRLTAETMYSKYIYQQNRILIRKFPSVG